MKSARLTPKQIALLIFIFLLSVRVGNEILPIQKLQTLVQETVVQSTHRKPQRMTQPKVTPPTVHTSRLSGHYEQKWIDNQIRSSRYAFARCFLEGAKLSSGRVKLELLWSPRGVLQDLKTQPDTEPKVDDCITQVVKGWNLPIHPGNQPFSYSATLVLN